MALIDRLIQRAADGSLVAAAIPGHLFLQLLVEVAAGRLTQAQANALIETGSGAPLVGAEITDAQSIMTWVNAVAAANRPTRYLQVDAIVGLGAQRAPDGAGMAGYSTPAEVRAKLVALGALAA